MRTSKLLQIAEGSTCPVCGGGVLHRNVGEVTFSYKGESISFDNYVSHVCDSCGEDFVAPGDNVACEKELAAFRNHVDGLLSPQEIRRVREALSLTQTRFAAILGVGAKNFAKYESGAMRPSKTTSHLLRILFHAPSMLELVFDGGLEQKRKQKATFTQAYKATREGGARLVLQTTQQDTDQGSFEPCLEREKCA